VQRIYYLREGGVALYKLKNKYIDKMVASRMSSYEIDFILYVAEFQDVTGMIESVYYKDVCDALGISIQKFYDILKSLSLKGLITYDKVNYADVRVKLVGNDFSGNSFKKGSHGYLKVTAKDFRNPNFRDMKAGAKALYLYMQRFTKGKHMHVHNFYTEFCKLFHVKEKTLQKYLRQLKEYGFLCVSKKRNKSNNYEMTMKLGSALDKTGPAIQNEKQLYLDNIKELVRRNFRRYVPNENAEKVLQDVANLINTRKTQTYRNITNFLFQAIRLSFERQRDEGKDKILLNAALVNKCLTSVIDEYLKEKCLYA